ncbi:charged multivesicular body protein 7 isoform X2 [Amborella trichopoda]|uniref:charged multivesicular body protein 7 isoform X2 n=1 Tax=Amborella trichopoda TaxID=13333 RepID=UPI0009C09511|nr:charged multivesicular body protein 7 isoform X2 [Amborella trichopoda]|eukprot:XP_020520601.1 charged multivesicular body protein 7 isoform X2 [Amborella trichopoda]
MYWDLKDPSSSHLHHMFKQVMNLVSTSLSGPQSTIEDRLILASLVQERASQVVGILSESHWTSSCVITTAKFQSLCKGNDEAAAVMSYLSGCGRARYLSINKKDCIEGVKLSLVPAVVPATSSLDYDTLRLVWTLERLQHQLEVLNQRYENARKSALALVKSGSKQAAVGYLRHSKSISESRTKCVSFINRVDEVLGLIADAESTKKVNEAIQIGARAIKENGISMEEVQICLQELNEGASSQKQIDEALQLPPFSYLDMEDEEVEEEFKRLKEEIGEVKVHETVPKNASKAAQEETQELAQSLSKGLSKLTLEPA